MTRILACLSAVLFSCCAVFAQAPEPAAQVPSGITTTASPEVAEFQKIEDAWDNAINTHDQYSLELVLSPLFIDIAGNGEITTRNQQLANVITNDDKTMHMTQHVITVRMLGDTAVVNGTYDLHHKVGSKDVDSKGIFTHVFERQHGTWQCVNAQRTALRQDEPGVKKKKKSDAQEPFHIPLFSHDKDKQ